MLKKVRGYLQKGLVAAVLTGASMLSGCGVSDPFHEVFRHDEKKNMAPLTKIVEVDYNEYDSKKDYGIINNRAYLKEDTKPNPVLEKIVDISPSARYRIPAINATFIEDGNDIILSYGSRLPAPDLSELIGKYLDNIQIDTRENTLIFSGKKEAFNFNDPEKKFSRLTALLEQFDLPAKQIRMKLSIVEYFNDNTYNRDLSLEILKEKMNVVDLILPSVTPTPDERKETPPLWTGLRTGININPFYNYHSERYDVKSAIKFLNSHGETKTLSDIDVLVSNGQPVKFKNTTSIPYPEAIVVGVTVIDAITYRDTGTTIEMTPFANEEGFITIKLPKAESGEHIGYYGVLQRPTFRTADLGSEFTVRNGMTYFAGTSLFTRYKSVKRGLPLLDLIPVLGELFSSREIENSQSQLLYFIEARVIDRDSLVGTEVKKIEEEVLPVLEGIGRVKETELEEIKEVGEVSKTLEEAD